MSNNQVLADQVASLEQLVESLQVKVAYQDDTIESLNQTIIRQQKAIQDINYNLEKLVEKIKAMPESDSPGSNDIELPPHY